MCNSLKAVVLNALPVMFSAGLYAKTHQHSEMNAAGDASIQQIIKGAGAIKGVDLSNKKIMIFHRAIPVVSWPVITMRFTFVDAGDGITALKADTHADFTFVQQDNISLLKSINNTQS